MSPQRRDLRHVCDDDRLAVLCRSSELQPDGLRDLSSDARVDLVVDRRVNGRDSTRGPLYREGQPRQLTAGGDPLERLHSLAGVGLDEQLHLVYAELRRSFAALDAQKSNIGFDLAERSCNFGSFEYLYLS